MIAPQPCQPHRGAQFPGSCLLPAGDLDSAPEADLSHRRSSEIPEEAQFAVQPMQLRFRKLRRAEQPAVSSSNIGAGRLGLEQMAPVAKVIATASGERISCRLW
jgi:hypothetical protein